MKKKKQRGFVSSHLTTHLFMSEQVCSSSSLYQSIKFVLKFFKYLQVAQFA